MTSFYNLLKYSATGIASPDMTYFDKMRASTLMGGVVKTLTGQPPLTFKADGTPLISWSMKGNGSQTGTPTPDAPIMPEFVGTKTGNLFDQSTITAGNYATLTGTIANSSYYCSDFIPISAATYYFQNIVGGNYQNSTVVYDANKQGLRYAKLTRGARVSGAITFQSGDAYIRINCYYQTDVNTVMINLGSTALPYEPFGWAEKITCAGQTVPVYLGQTQTVRKIRKLVLDGTETSWASQGASGGNVRFRMTVTYAMQADRAHMTSMCTHFALGAEGSTWGTNLVYTIASGYLYMRYDAFQTSEDFKSYLAAQYENGTPVTIWYVLANEETTISNEPLAKIGDYADELHSTDAGVTIPTAKGKNTLTVDTELQPSSMTITYKG